MIAAWMLYTVVLGGLVVLAATPVERLVRDAGGATRRVWSIALLATVVLPVGGVLIKDSAAAVEVGDRLVVASPSAGVVMESVATLASLDAVLLSVWAVATTLLLSVLVGGLVATGVASRRWRREVVDGVPVLVSRDVGPAVIGIHRSRIVLPRWSLALTPEQRAWMLRHEQEHLRAGDPGLLLLVALTVAVMPWNPAAWYAAARTRLAIEVDCDRRVLGTRDPDLRGYAELLLSVGARQSRLAYGVGFSVGRPFLEQRIDRMTAPLARTSRLQLTLVTAGLLGVLAAAWAVPQPVRAAKVGLDAVPMCPDGGASTTDLSVEMLAEFERST